MFLDRKGLRAFVYRDSIDMRCGFERLHSYCIHQMAALMDQGHVYLFFGKNRKRIKAIFYDGTGLVLISKRMEKGSFMSLPDLLGRSEISLAELKMIFHGSIIRTPVVDRSLSAATAQNRVTQRESVDLPTGITQSRP